MRNTILLAAAIVGFSTLGAVAQAQQPTMSIQATGTVTAEPDQAQVRFGVHSAGQDAKQAMQDNKDAMKAAFDALLKAGVPQKDIATTGLALTPRYDNSQKIDRDSAPRILGYEAHNIVSVTVSDISGLGQVLDNLVAAGVNGIDQVSFGLKDSSALEAQARIQAAKSARAKAEDYANAIGTKITGIVSMSEQGGVRPVPYAKMEMARAVSSAPMPVSGGEMDVSVTVSVVFGLDGELN